MPISEHVSFQLGDFFILILENSSKHKTPILKSCFLSVGRFAKDEYSIAVLYNLLTFLQNTGDLYINCT